GLLSAGNIAAGDGNVIAEEVGNQCSVNGRRRARDETEIVGPTSGFTEINGLYRATTSEERVATENSREINRPEGPGLDGTRNVRGGIKIKVTKSGLVRAYIAGESRRSELIHSARKGRRDLGTGG